MTRLSFLVISSRGDRVLIAIASVTMPTQEAAAQLKELTDTHGTGNITELSRERGTYQYVRFTGDIYASSLRGDTFVNAQAQPVARGVGGLALTSLVTNLVE